MKDRETVANYGGSPLRLRRLTLPAIKVGRWSSMGTRYFTYERVYVRHRWTPLCKAQWRHGFLKPNDRPDLWKAPLVARLLFLLGFGFGIR